MEGEVVHRVVALHPTHHHRIHLPRVPTREENRIVRINTGCIGQRSRRSDERPTVPEFERHPRVPGEPRPIEDEGRRAGNPVVRVGDDVIKRIGRVGIVGEQVDQPGCRLVERIYPEVPARKGQSLVGRRHDIVGGRATVQVFEGEDGRGLS